MEPKNTLTPEVSAAKLSHEQPRPDDLSTDSHRRLIGWIGLLLPGAMLVAVWLFQGGTELRRLDSISAYFYSCAVAAFLGMLISLALFLLTYRGFDNPTNEWDRRLSNWAAIAALGVAAFPTAPPPGINGPSWWADWMGLVHLGFAVALFSLFAAISGWRFTMKHTKAFWPTIWGWLFGWWKADKEVSQAERSKENRNRFHFLCAAVIVLAMLTAVGCKLIGWQIFWAEWVALAAFAVSWLVKGRVRLGEAAKQGVTDVLQVVAWSPARAGEAAVASVKKEKAA